jgi:hypothetical protein
VAGLLERAIAAHGGADLFARVERFDVHLRTGGLAYSMPMHTPPGEYRFEVAAHEPRNTIVDWPAPGLRGVFTPNQVRIEDADGTVVSSRNDPRGGPRPLKRRVRWDDLDFLFFVGYAVWNYLTTPFMLALPGIESREANGGRLDVEFPAWFPTHSRKQSFYFGEDGLLRRLDYTAGFIGPLAIAVHHCSEHRDFGGIVVPTGRRVVPRAPGHRPLPGPTMIWAKMLDVVAVGRE